jgi:hypothetical protein
VAGLAVVACIQVTAACHTGCKATLHACSNTAVNQRCGDHCGLKQLSALLLHIMHLLADMHAHIQTHKQGVDAGLSQRHIV